jgi:6-phospho-3-hexuloisomerase
MKSFEDYKKRVLLEIGEKLQSYDSAQAEIFVKAIINADKIILTGAGRMGYMIKAFTMRLSHIGFNTWALGDSTVPQVSAGDLVIIASGSGETATMIEIAKKVLTSEATLLVLTTERESTIGSMANVIIDIPGTSSLDGEGESQQPMKTLVEQSTLLYYDTIAMMLMDITLKKNKDLHNNHNTLE